MIKLKYAEAFIIILVVTNFSFSQNFWVHTNGPTNNRINSFTEKLNTYIYTTSDYSGIFRSSNNGTNWQAINSGLLVPHILSITVNENGDLFAGAFGGGMYRYLNTGTTWEPINNGIYNYWDIHSILVRPNQDLILGTCCDVYKSTNNGNDWTRASFTGYRYRALAQDKMGNIYAGYPGIIRSTDNGENWDQIFSINRDVRTILINDSGYIFVGTFNSGGLWRSTDWGMNWERKNYGFPSSDINITSLVNISEDYIFAGTESEGVFVSTDFGEEWISINDGLTDQNILCLMLKSDGYIFAGTNGSGVFRSLSSITNISDDYSYQNFDYHLSQNYPNPFNPSTIIKFSIPSVETHRDASLLITLKVFDILGKEVATLVNEEKQAGSYEVEFNSVETLHVTSLPSGVYFYQLKAGDYIETKKMIFMK